MQKFMGDEGWGGGGLFFSTDPKWVGETEKTETCFDLGGEQESKPNYFKRTTHWEFLITSLNQLMGPRFNLFNVA